MTIITDRNYNATQKAVEKLKAYGQYIVDHAENIIGNIDAPNYVIESGIHIAFTLVGHDQVPILEVSHEYIVRDA